MRLADTFRGEEEVQTNLPVILVASKENSKTTACEVQGQSKAVDKSVKRYGYAGNATRTCPTHTDTEPCKDEAAR